MAEQILSRMRLEGVIPNAATYNAAISGCSVGGEWDRALRLLREMEATDPREEARPEALSYSLVLKACGRDGQWETALELLEEMEVWKPREGGKCWRELGEMGLDFAGGTKCLRSLVLVPSLPRLCTMFERLLCVDFFLWRRFSSLMGQGMTVEGGGVSGPLLSERSMRSINATS